MCHERGVLGDVIFSRDLVKHVADCEEKWAKIELRVKTDVYESEL